ncbi:MAG: exo-alpha-sialidase [Saprospiraceae bacterium]|nr:exo-alpha-sialidase [Saprospiraceae bacterium]
MNYNFGLTFLMLFFGAQTQAQKIGISDKDIVLKIESTPEHPRNSEGDFVTLDDGRILFIYTQFESVTSDHAPAKLMGRYSSDNGKTWTNDDVLIVDKEGDMNVMSVSLLRLQNGNIALFYARKNSLDDCIPQLRISKDGGETWGEPKSVITDRNGYFVLNNDRVIQLKSGRILVPVSFHKKKDTEWSHKGILRCYFSDDQGLTWKSGDAVPSPDSVVTQEPGVVELSDGRIMMIIRASGGAQYHTFSTDQGQNWSYAERTEIASPISPASLERLSTGELLLIWNNNGKAGPGYYKATRSPLSLAISQDEGKHFLIPEILNTTRKECFVIRRSTVQENMYCWDICQS